LALEEAREEATRPTVSATSRSPSSLVSGRTRTREVWEAASWAPTEAECQAEWQALADAPQEALEYAVWETSTGTFTIAFGGAFRGAVPRYCRFPSVECRL